MTTVEVLRKARALYEANPSHAPGCDPVEPGRVCLMWSLDYAAGPRGADKDVYSAIDRAAGTNQLVKFNAEHTTAEVLAVFDRAIEAEAA